MMEQSEPGSARKKQKHTPKHQIIGDTKIDEARGNLDDEIDMKEWELIGPPGTFAEGVFKGFQRSNSEEVAVKVVSLQNPEIRRSQWVQEKLLELEKRGAEVTEEDRFKLYEEKVLMEMYNTQTLSSKHICFFVGYFKESCTYADKVLKDQSHAVRHYVREDQPDRPYGDKSVFFVMENLPGGDLFEYNASHKFGCGFLLAFEASAGATEEGVHDALRLFPPFLTASDSSELRTYTEFMYLDVPFLHAQTGAKGDAKMLVLKFNTNFKHKLDLKYRNDGKFEDRGMYMFAEDVQNHLIKQNLICNCVPITQQDAAKRRLYSPLPLFFNDTFIRTTLSQIMIALSHAHGAPLYHNDLKPDNIMFKYRVHAHSSNESNICAKIIDWGCGGFSKDSPNDTSHEYKPHEPPGKECDIFCVGNVLRFLFNFFWWKKSESGFLPKQLSGSRWKCKWNTSAEFQELDSSLCVPWNPNNDLDFVDLVRGMVHPNPKTRFSVKEVLRHRWMTVVRACELQESALASDQRNPHVHKLNTLLYMFAPPHLQRMHDESHDDGQNEETKFLDLVKMSELPDLRRSLDVLVTLPMLVKAPYAQGFISSNLVALLSKFVADYMYNDDYPQRHLPRTMVLLSQLASHQSSDILLRIFSAKYHEKQHHGNDADGRALLDLIAYGVFDCHDPDPNHKACSLYTMLMLIALSSPVEEPDMTSYKTQDVVKFLRDKKTKQPKPLQSIFEKLVLLLELLTHTPEDAEKLRQIQLTEVLSMKSPHLTALHKILSEAQQSPSEAANLLREGQHYFHSIRIGLLELQHALHPVCKDPQFSRFIDKFLALPDPGSQLLSIHKLLQYNDFSATDEMEQMLASNNGRITSSTHGILSRLVQALLNLSMIPSGLDSLVEGGDHSFLYRIMRCMQAVHLLYPKAFKVNDAEILAEKETSLYNFVVKLWFAAARRVPQCLACAHLDRDFLSMLEKSDASHLN